MYRKIQVRLLKDVGGLTEGTVLEVNTKQFMGAPVYQLPTDAGKIWVGTKLAQALIQ